MHTHAHNCTPGDACRAARHGGWAQRVSPASRGDGREGGRHPRRSPKPPPSARPSPNLALTTASNRIRTLALTLALAPRLRPRPGGQDTEHARVLHVSRAHHAHCHAYPMHSECTCHAQPGYQDAEQVDGRREQGGGRGRQDHQQAERHVDSTFLGAPELATPASSEASEEGS